MNKIMKQAQKMEQDFKKVQKEITDLKVKGIAGGNAVSVTLKGDYSVESIAIDPDLLKEDIEMVQDMVQVAFNNAVDQIRQESEKKMGSISGGFPGMPPLF